MDISEIVSLWKQLNIGIVNFNFSCGGDSMNDTDIEILDNDGNLIENEDIKNYIDDVVYQRVNFYVNSDGYYIGEAGTVEITLDEDGEDLYFCKMAQSEFSETHSEETTVTLTKKEAKFVADHVLNINGGEGGNVTNFKHDFIITDEELKLVDALENKLNDFASEYYFKTQSGESSDWFAYTTNENGEDLKLNGNKLTLKISKSFTTYRDSD